MFIDTFYLNRFINMIKIELSPYTHCVLVTNIQSRIFHLYRHNYIFSRYTSSNFYVNMLKRKN